MPEKPLLAADRVRAYLTLVPFLLERGQVSVEEAAAEFGTTVSEMRALVEKLTVIGLPGGDGYWQQPHELFDINWDLLDEHGIIEITNDVALQGVPRFTAREASALLAGLQLVAKVPRVSDTGLVDGLIAKLAHGAASAPAELVIAPSAVNEVQQLVSQALRDRVALSFRYQAPDAPETTRTVDPVRVLITEGQWYLQGWCHLREAMRTFHLDRVSEPELTDIPITHDEDVVAHTADAQGTPETAVHVRIDKELVPLLGEYLRSETVTAEGRKAIVPLLMADPRAVKRLAARFGGALEVTDPASARAAAREWAEAGLALYHQDFPKKHS